MKHISTIFFFLMLSILLSCETEIPFNGAETKPVLVVNCLACTDSVIQATVSASRFFLSNEYEFPAVTDATVALYVNGVFTENLTHTGLGVYRSNYIPAEGDVVRLNVSATGFEPVWAENAFPIATTGFQIDSTITKTDTTLMVYGTSYGGGGGGGDYGNPTWDTIGTTFSYIHEYKVRFSNPGGVPNYYRLVVHGQTVAVGYPLVNSYLNNFDDLVFGTKNNNLEGIFTESKIDRYNVFSDELIDGKTHTITFTYAQPFNTFIDSSYKSPWTVGDERSVSIDLQAISKSYYLYLVSLKALESSDPFMSEPVQIYTNINGGLGLLGTRTNKLRKFILPE